MKIIGHIILGSDIARVHMNIALSTKTETKTLAFVKVKIKKIRERDNWNHYFLVTN